MLCLLLHEKIQQQNLDQIVSLFLNGTGVTGNIYTIFPQLIAVPQMINFLK